MKEAGVEVITDLDRKAFSDALGTQVRDMFVKDVPQGADLLKAVDECNNHDAILAGVRLWR